MRIQIQPLRKLHIWVDCGSRSNLWENAYPDPTFEKITDPNTTFEKIADPDPTYEKPADLDPATEKMRIQIQFFF